MDTTPVYSQSLDAWFDYVVLGAGSAGCAVAGGLAKAGYRVALVEAGGASAGFWSRMPFGNVVQVPRFPGLNNWRYRTDPVPGLNGRRGYQPRGRVVGGSSAINGMIYLRGRPADYDGWAAMGCPGWDWDAVQPVFERFERLAQTATSEPDETTFGIEISDCLSHTCGDEVFLRAARERGIACGKDLNAPQAEAIFPFRFAQYGSGLRKGHRCTAADAFVHALPSDKRPHIFSNTTIDRIVTHHDKLSHIECQQGRRILRLGAHKEAILCAGTFGSPAILQRSGFGPGHLLNQLGIDVVQDLPGVGANLQDHVQCSLHYACSDRRFMGLTPSGLVELVAAVLAWPRTGTGWGSSTFTQSGGYLKSDETQLVSDLQCHFFSGIVQDHGNTLHAKRGYSAQVYVLDPESRGQVEIRSPEPQIPPSIAPNYFAVADDLRRTRQGLKRLQHLLTAPAFAALGAKPLLDIAGMDDSEIEAYVRTHADTAYHPVGTCRMGSDQGAVVDPTLKLRGIGGVRVADASIMPRLISSNTNPAAMMIGSRAADLILKEG